MPMFQTNLAAFAVDNAGPPWLYAVELIWRSADAIGC